MARRLTDIVLGLAGLAVAAPVLVAIAAAVRLRDRAPVIYRARRVGQHGREFQLLKFRTMVPAGGSSVTVWADPRVTPLGRRLRRLKLDELAQMFNVLRGEMSITPPGELSRRATSPTAVPLVRASAQRDVSRFPTTWRWNARAVPACANGKGLPCSSSSRSTLRRTIDHASPAQRDETLDLVMPWV